MTNGPLIFAALVGSLMVFAFIVFWRITASRDLADKRLRGLGENMPLDDEPGVGSSSITKSLSPIGRLVNGFGFGPILASALTAADLSMTATEYALLVFFIALGGFALGWWRGGFLLALVGTALFGYIPIFYLSYRAKQRKLAFANQLPEVLTLLVGALRAGHGLSQALGDLAEQMPPPASVEFGRVIRAMNLGLPVARALNDLTLRIGTSDLDLVITAIVVQHELGGNLATTLETISDTIRDRIRMKREIRVLTSQQRLTGGLLAFLPIALVVLLTFVNPGYITPLFAPGLIRVLPAAAVVMQILGYIVMRKIMDIEV